MRKISRRNMFQDNKLKAYYLIKYSQMACLADVAEVESPEGGVAVMLAASQRQSITRTGCLRHRG